jgi:hypothetical protein
MNCGHAVKSYLHSIQEIIFRLPTEERGVLESSLVSIWGWCSLFRGVSRSNPQEGIGGIGGFSGSSSIPREGGGVGRGGDWVRFRDLCNPQRGGGEVRSVQGALQSSSGAVPSVLGALQSIRGRQGRFREFSNPGKGTGVFQGFIQLIKRGWRGQGRFRELVNS